MGKETGHRPPPSAEKEAIKSKLNSDNQNAEEAKLGPNDLLSITQNTIEALESNDSILALFPDIELAMQILASSIISPKDLTTTSIVYAHNENGLPTSLNNGLLDIVKKHVKSKYMLEEKLFDIVSDALFKSGSHLEAIIPESAVDNIINGTPELSLEAYGESIKDAPNALFNKVSSKLDDYPDVVKELDTVLNISDYTVVDENPGILDLKNIYADAVRSKTKSIVGIGIESAKEYDEAVNKGLSKELADIFKPTPVHENSEAVTVLSESETTRKSVGSPLIMNLPVESVVPVYLPGNPDKHLGYFVLLDEYGTPLTRIKSWQIDNTSKLTELVSASSSISEKAKVELLKMTDATPTIKNMSDIAGMIIDKRIRESLLNSKLSGVSDIGDISHVYHVMTSRVLAKQKTRMLYLPEEVVVNYTFNYKENGLGESLIEKIAVLASMRAVLLFSRLMADIKNSITNTKVKATIPDEDPDAKATMASIRNHALQSRQNLLPLGIRRMDQLTDWSVNAGMMFDIKHKTIPDMEIETEEITTDIKEPEGRLDDNLKKQITQSFGLTPEMVDNGFEPEFATSIVSNNSLLHKRVQLHQLKLNPMITKHVKKISTNDAVVNDNLRNYVLDNMSEVKKTLSDDAKEKLKATNATDDYVAEWIVDTFIHSMVLSLPKPDNHEQNSLKDAYDEYRDSIDDYIEDWLSEDALPSELVGEFGNVVDDFKIAAKSTLLRKWMTENNFMPELQRIVDINDEGKPSLDVHTDFNAYVKNIAIALKDFKKANFRIKAKADKNVADPEPEPTLTGDVTGTEDTAVDPTL